MMPSPVPSGGMKGVTQEEVSKLAKAMKDGQFRDHMEEYCKEVSDPANRKEYITYLEQLEAQGEMPDGQCLLRADPGCCVKTSIRFKNGQTQKLFINIVHTERLDDLDLRPGDKGGRQVYLPYSLSPPRPDRDLKDAYCMTCDCAVSSRTFFQAAQNPQILKMIVDTACDGLGANFLKGFEEVRKDFKLMERLKCKGGFPMPMSVRSELMKDKGGKKHTPKIDGDAVTPGELRKMRQEAKDKKSAEREQEDREIDEAAAAAEAARAAKAEAEARAAPRIRVPKHRLIHSGTIDLTDFMEAKNQPLPATTTVPKVLRLVVELPTVKKSSDVSLEVTSCGVVIEVPGKYYLDLPFSYEVEETNGTAKFDKAKQELTLELPVVPKPPIFPPQAREAGVDDEAAGAADDGGLSEGGGSEDGECEETADREGRAEGKDCADSFHATEVAPDGRSSLQNPSAEAEPEQQQQQKRETLEFDAALSLHIAGPAAAAEAAAAEAEPAEPAVTAVDDLPGELEEGQDLPAFQPSEFFDGTKRGYYFGRGPEGLGYYRDMQRRPPPAARPQPTAPAGGCGEPSGPWVQEVPPARSEDRPREPLPPALQAFLTASASLSRRLPAADVDPPGQVEPSVESYQNRQNVMMFVDLPRASEVADLQLAVAGHRLSLAFCTRPAPSATEAAGTSSSSGSSARWRRWRLRRTLCGAADPRQWHAEVVDRGEAALPQLGLVLRKARRGDVWPEVFDEAVAPGAQEPWEPAAATAAAAGGGGGDDDAQAGAADGALAREPEDGEVLPQDSAELDVAVDAGPTPAPGPGASAAMASAAASAAVSGTAQVTATAAMVQSATVMGQSVLLTSRLMYQLL